MPRKSILEVMRGILKLLSDKKEYSTKSISYKLKSRWETTLKALEFLEEIKIVKERKGDVLYKAERLWSLK